MKKKIGLLVALLICTIAGTAQNNLSTISGTVYENAEKTITVPFAKVWVETPSGKRAVLTDDNGRYKIDALNPGVYNLAVKSIGFDTLTYGNISTDAGGIATVDPNFSDLEDGGIMGTAVHIYRDPLIRKDIPKLVISAEDIENSPLIQNPKRLIVDRSSDINMVEGTGQIIIRGSRPGDAIYYIDGVKANDMSSVPGVSLRGLQAYTGGVPASFGDTTGGVIELETKGYFDLYYAWKANH